MQIGGRSTHILFEALLTSITVRSSTAPHGSSGVVVVGVRSESVGSSQSDNSISSSELVSAESELSAR